MKREELIEMKREELIELARNLGVSEQYYHSAIKRLIWAIQGAQGKDQCYLSDERYTCSGDCKWDSSCKKLTASWLR